MSEMVCFNSYIEHDACFRELVDFMDNQKFLLMTKMQQWMESNLNKVLNSFKGKESVCMIPVMLENKNKIKFEVGGGCYF